MAAFWDKFKKKQKYRYVSEGSYGQAYWATQKDKQFITEAYNKVVWVYSCVMQISSATSSVPWLLYRKGRGGRNIEIEQHPILDLLNNKANAFMSSRDFIDLWATYLALEGKFYAEYVNPSMPTQIVPLYPHYMKPIPSKEEFVSGYKYDNYSTIYYDKEEVLWSKFSDPLDIYEGLSPIRALSRTIDTENEAVNWNKSTLQNSGVPAGVFTVQNPSPELIDNLRDEWKRRYGGGSNARIPLVLNADRATYQPIGLTSIDMDFLNQRKLNRTEICSAFGVPSQLVGDPEGQTYSNFGEAVKSFWENTIIPRYLEHMKQKLQSDLLPRYADNLVLVYDLSKIQALKESQDALAKRTVELWKSGLIKRNEARFALDYEEVQDGDVFFNDLGFTTEESLPSEGEQKSLDAKKKLFKQFERQRNPFYDRVTKQISEAFNEQRKKIINATYNSDNFNNEVLQIIEDDKDRFVKLFQKIYKDVIRHFGAKTYQDIQSRIKSTGASETKAFDFTTDDILKYITETSAEKVTFITETTKTDIKNIIIDSVAQGASILTMTESLDKLYLDKIIPNRSRTIARTEVVSASNYGSLAGAEQTTPKLKKVWIPTFDDSTRDSHRSMANHPPINLNEYFDVSGSRGRYPADFSLPASEAINCRCAIGYEYAEETPKRGMRNAVAETQHGRRRGIILDTVYERQNND